MDRFWWKSVWVCLALAVASVVASLAIADFGSAVAFGIFVVVILWLAWDTRRREKKGEL